MVVEVVVKKDMGELKEEIMRDIVGISVAPGLQHHFHLHKERGYRLSTKPEADLRQTLPKILISSFRHPVSKHL